MDRSEIPRLEMEDFAQGNFQVPFLNVEQYPVNASLFTIRDRRTTPVKDYISPNRRRFYKIFHMTEGTGVLTVGLHQYELGPGDIAFLHPDEIMSWRTTSEATGGHFCLVHPQYFEDAPHLVQLFRQYPYLQPSRAVVQLSLDQSAKIDGYFKAILAEENGTQADKKQAILLHLQLILLEAQRAGRTLADTAVPEHYRYIHGFLSLLEQAFQVQDMHDVVKLKTATEFAAQLHVHPNYLNTLVKKQTGKTVREHIQERLLYEAKTLLLQTDWDIQTVSDALGFSGPAAFTTLFHKKEKVSPSRFREQYAAAPHL